MGLESVWPLKMAEMCFQEDETKVEKDSLSLLEESKPLILLGHLGQQHFLTLKESGSKFKTKNFFFIYTLNEGSGFDIGFTISKKFGPAYKRNRLRRLLKESFRKTFFEEQFQYNKKILVNVIALTKSTDNQKVDFSDVHKQVQQFINHQTSLKSCSSTID